ncbi:MAG: hypothetical protein Q9167_003667 [Letrouitia subvulpina]
MSSMSQPGFAGLADQITQLVSEIDIEEVVNSKDEAARFKALRAAQKLVIRLKKPGELASEATSELTAPTFFAKEGYHTPSTTYTPSNVARNTNLDFFSWMQKHPGPHEEFNIWMSAPELRLSAWIDWFPVRDHLLQSNDLNQDEILLVDIAGGIGQDLKALQKRYPDAKGRLVLQDMDKVVAQAVKEGLPDRIEAMAIDLFAPQPVQGARNYSINAVLHNWSDADAVTILKRIAAAMFSAGRSVLLINDVVLPDRDASLEQAAIDMNMMFVFGQAKERTERQWRALLTEAGLSVKKFWSPPSPGKGVVEAVKA